MIVFGVMMTSIATEYWQIMLAQGFCVGIGAGCVFVPGVSILPTYFSTRKALATGIATSGSSLGAYSFLFLLLGEGMGEEGPGLTGNSRRIVPDYLHETGAPDRICVGDESHWLHCPVRTINIFYRDESTNFAAGEEEVIHALAVERCAVRHFHHRTRACVYRILFPRFLYPELCDLKEYHQRESGVLFAVDIERG